jgi:hypothetical protein
MSATTDGTGEMTELPAEEATIMHEATTIAPEEVTTTGVADMGDVAPDDLGIGFSDASLEMAEADEELDAFEASTNPATDAAEAIELPDEESAAPVGFGADAGDVDGDGPPVAFDDEHLRRAEDDDELDAIEPAAADAAPATVADAGGAGDDPTLPDEDEDEDEDQHEDEAPAPAPAPAAGLVTQSSHAPTRKVKAAGLGGVLGAIPAPLLSVLDLVHVSDATLGVISSVLTVLGSLAAGYLARESTTTTTTSAAPA